MQRLLSMLSAVRSVRILPTKGKLLGLAVPGTYGRACYVSAVSIALLTLVFCSLTANAQYVGSAITSGTTWQATDGSQIKAHGGQILQEGSTYYWIGEVDTSGGEMAGINCYSSTDLATWTFVADILPAQASGDLSPSELVERPKVLYNASTHQYVMWVHIYNTDSVGYATSPSVCGTYTYLGSSQPLGNPSYDIGSFQDTDGTAYLLSADYDLGIIVYQMAPDYLSAVSIVDPKSTWGDYEAPAMFKANGYYFLLMSHETGWSSNDDQYSYATSISGPWSTPVDFATPNTNTYNSQSTYVLPVTGTNGTTYMYMGDRWNSSNIANSTYVWLPLTISGNTVSMANYPTWYLDVPAGTWSAPPIPPTFSLSATAATVTDGSTGTSTVTESIAGGFDSPVTLTVSGLPPGVTAVFNPTSITGAGTSVLTFTADSTAPTGTSTVTITGTPVSGTAETTTLTLIVSAAGPYTELINENSGLCVSALNSTEGTQLQQVTCSGSTLLEWELATQGSGYYIVNENTGMVADDSGQSKSSGGAIIEWVENGGSNQEWTFTSNGSGAYTIKNVYSKLCLDVAGASTSSGALIEQITCKNPVTTDQLWQISISPPPALTITPTAATVTYGGTATLTASATFASGTQPTQGLVFQVNGVGQTPATCEINGTKLTCTLAYSPGNLAVGSYPVYVYYGGDANYAAIFASTTLTVNPAPLTVTANNTSMAQGAAIPAFIASYTGFVGTDSAAVLSGAPSLTTTATSSSSAGTYPIVASLGTLSAKNYVFATFVNGTLSIVAAPTVVITTSAVISGSNSTGYTTTITIANSGTGAASNVILSTALLGGVAGTPLPQGPVSIPAGGSTTFSVSFPGSVGLDGAAVSEKYSGTYTGGSFSASMRSVALP